MTYDLDLESQLGLTKVKVNAYTKNQGHRPNGLAVRVLTDRHIDRTDSITSNAEAVGNKASNGTI